jgi:hypothetical protein
MMSSKSSTPSPLSSINHEALFFSFPSQLKLSMGGAGGLKAWDSNLRKHVPAPLSEQCEHFIAKSTMPQPIMPNEHDITIRTSAPLLVQPNPSSTPLKTTNPQTNLMQEIDSASSSAEETSTPVPNLLDQTPPLQTTPPTSTQPMVRKVFKYPHDGDNYLTSEGVFMFERDMDKYESKLDTFNKEASAFFSWIVKYTIGETPVAMLEANDNWDFITSSKDSKLLREVIEHIVTPTNVLRSLSSLQALIENSQGSTPHQVWAKQTKSNMTAVMADFAHPKHPDALCPKKLLTAVILMTTTNKDFVKHHMNEGGADLSNINPHVLLDRLQESNTNHETYAARTAAVTY